MSIDQMRLDLASLEAELTDLRAACAALRARAERAEGWARVWKRAARDEREKRALLALAHIGALAGADELRAALEGLLYVVPRPLGDTAFDTALDAARAALRALRAPGGE